MISGYVNLPSSLSDFLNDNFFNLAESHVETTIKGIYQEVYNIFMSSKDLILSPINLTLQNIKFKTSAVWYIVKEEDSFTLNSLVLGSMLIIVAITKDDLVTIFGEGSV